MQVVGSDLRCAREGAAPSVLLRCAWWPQGDDLIPYDNGTLAQIKVRLAEHTVQVVRTQKASHPFLHYENHSVFLRCYRLPPQESLAGGPNAAPDGW